MTKWEHGELSFGSGAQPYWHGPSGFKDRPPGTNAVESLNKLGAEGWQVSGVTQTTTGFLYVLSRPVGE